MLMLSISLVGWPIIVFIVSFILGIIYGLFWLTVRTFNDEYNIITGGFVDVFKDLFKFINSFWDFNYNMYFDGLIVFENMKTKNPFDISIPQIIIGLILAIYISIV